jgi:Cft2 family RNA processing exonuclease
MLATIWQLMQKKKLTTVDIYTGGIGTKINRAYDYNRYTVNRTDQEFELSLIPQKDYFDISNPEDFFKHPCIVLASSGMMIKSTSSFTFAKSWLKHKDSAIFTVGYTDPATPGFVIANSKKGDEIDLNDSNKNMKVNCEIKNFKFSAHARREGLLKIVDKLSPDNVILIHGDEKAMDWMGKSILGKRRNIKLFVAKKGSEIIFP